jgi:NTE family protein
MKRIDLALQGGGAHGAFTWGVLHRLLTCEELWIAGVSGTSAGAMNAVVLADGLVRGGGPGAIAALERFWRAVAERSRLTSFAQNPLDILFGRESLSASPMHVWLDMWSRMFSPYQLNPLNLNPLRDLLLAQVDFDRVRSCDSLEVFVAVTNVRTGKPHIFRRPELSADAVMASACLPEVFQAVEIDGESYWDGGYMGNPVLSPLVEESDADDLVLVQINPIHRADVPRSVPDIANRLNEIIFNASLIKEVRAIWLMKRLVEDEGLDRERYRVMRLHRIHAERELGALHRMSKLNTEWAFLQRLHDLGWRVADDWLAQNLKKIGVRSTVDVESVFLWPGFEGVGARKIVMSPERKQRRRRR